MQRLKETLKGGDRRTWVVLAGSAVLMTVFVYQGSPMFYVRHLTALTPPGVDVAAARHAYEFFASFLLFFLVPVLLVKVGFGENLKDYGLCAGDFRFGLAFVGIAVVVLPFLLWLGAQQADFQAQYPLWRGATRSVGGYFAWISLYLFYYVGWEFFFRGFLLFGLRDATSPFIAIMMQTLPSTMIHWGKPQGETFSAILAGIVFGMVALRTRSILYVLAVHWYVGALTHLFCGL